jgi:hypothetical protein
MHSVCVSMYTIKILLSLLLLQTLHYVEIALLYIVGTEHNLGNLVKWKII